MQTISIKRLPSTNIHPYSIPTDYQDRGSYSRVFTETRRCLHINLNFLVISGLCLDEQRFSKYSKYIEKISDDQQLSGESKEHVAFYDNEFIVSKIAL